MSERIEKVDLVNTSGLPGTEFTTVTGPLSNVQRMLEKSTGTISGIIKKDPSDDSPATRYDLSGFRYGHLFPSNWNGIPRYSITAKGMYNGDVYLVAKYKYEKSPGSNPKSGSRFRTSRGTESIQVYCKHDNSDQFLGDLGAGNTRPSRQIRATLLTVTWNSDRNLSVKSVHPPPGIEHGLEFCGTVNKNIVTISGISFPRKSLRYIGADSNYQDGHWTYYHNALFRVYYPATDGIHKFWEYPTAGEGTPKYLDVYQAKKWT